ncbi:MAG: DUF411 domain-containing protein [Betaproteobacteria bacterium]|nr:DUF411 domain-containing protein [Betaproteobacteria bacterium]
MHQSSITARRRVLAALAATPLALVSLRASSAAPMVSVTKLEGCGCCDDWAGHLRKNGFSVSVRAVPDLAPVRKKYGMVKDFDTCHTALVEGYVIDGHVPAVDIHRLLRSKLKVAGLVVPGMPAGSPGMEGARSDPYEVLTFDRNGAVQVYARYR